MARTDVRPLKTERWRALRSVIARRASLRCEHCFTFLGLRGEVDHVVPRSDIDLVGIGVFDPSNLQYLCPSCHSAKTARERWAGHEKKPPKANSRTKTPGRDAYLAATGLPSTTTKEDKNA